MGYWLSYLETTARRLYLGRACGLKLKGIAVSGGGGIHRFRGDPAPCKPNHKIAHEWQNLLYKYRQHSTILNSMP